MVLAFFDKITKLFLINLYGLPYIQKKKVSLKLRYAINYEKAMVFKPKSILRKILNSKIFDILGQVFKQGKSF